MSTPRSATIGNEGGFPFLCSVAILSPTFCALAVGVLWIVKSDLILPVAFFTVVLSVAGIMLSLIAAFFREGVWWLFAGLLINGILIYGVTFVPIH